MILRAHLRPGLRPWQVLACAGALAIVVDPLVQAQDRPEPGEAREREGPGAIVGQRGAAIAARVLAGSTVGARRVGVAGEPISIRTGFVPDPIVVRGTVRRDAPLARLGEGCTGLGSEGPTQRVRMETRFGFLRIFATGPDDLTLAVRTEDGAVLCSDDRFGRHPSVEGRFAPGLLEVWVGLREGDPTATPATSTLAPGTFELELTETRSIRPGVRSGEEGERLSLAIEAGLDVRCEAGRDGDMRLRRGFLPDPRYLEGSTRAEGEHVDVGGLGDVCRGFVTAAPSHVLNLQDDLDFFQIYVANALESTTLVVVGPDGSVACDSADGDHPHVTRDAWPSGLYRIWVGAHRADAVVPYRIGLSEIRRAR
ncbi:MAG: hypothetical protein OHK0013_19600 [Sandaracinaceae bacterium]